MCWYQDFREKMSHNEDALKVIDILDELETRKVTEDEITSVSEIIANLNVSDIVRAGLYRRLRMLKKRIERTVQNDFGAYIRFLREKKSYSLKEIQIATGVSTSYLNRLEMGKRLNPSIIILTKLAQVFGVHITEMLTVATTDDSAKDLVELLLATQFSVNNHILEGSVKATVINILLKIIECDWVNQYQDTIELMEMVDTFKKKQILGPYEDKSEAIQFKAI